MNEKWVDKYRPKTFDDIIGNGQVVERIRSNLNNLPDLLFYGHAGIGKTALAKVIIDTLNADYIELNASDERGVAVIQGRVKNFAKSESLPKGIKIVFLDEADGLTKDAQDALKRTMEKYSSSCRFILTANNKQKIIEPIISRCGGGYEFLPIPKEDIKKRLIQILTLEAMTIRDDAFDEVYSKSFGDFRQLLNSLQTLQGITKDITLTHLKDVKENANYILVFNAIKEKKYSDACRLITKDDVIKLYYAIQNLDIGKKKGQIAIAFAEYDYRRQFAVLDFLQLHALIAQVMNILEV